MHPLVLTFVSPILLLFAWVMYSGSGDDEAAKARARALPPPAAVKIEEFDASKHRGPSGEVVILAQADLTKLSDLVFSKGADEKRRYVLAPLYPVGATDVTGPAYGVIVERTRLTNQQIKDLTVGEGPLGPILKLDGELVDASEIGAVPPRQNGQYHRVDPRPLYLAPSPRGRTAALAPSDAGRQAAFFVAGLAALLFVLGIALQVQRVRRRRAESDGYHGSAY
jgi:hypothetical protein